MTRISPLYLSLTIMAALSLGAAVPASAQSSQADREEVHKRIELDMIDMPDLVQALTKNLGQLHYLRTICFGKTDQTWRVHATKMMEIESPSDREKRRLLIKSFNDGYYDQEKRHPACSESVSREAAAIAENGRHLASMLGDPYRE